jgi:hypothetical protein
LWGRERRVPIFDGTRAEKLCACDGTKNNVHFVTERRNDSSASRILCGLATGDKKVVGRQYVKRQASFLLKFAQTTSDPQVAAALVEKAADLKARLDQSNVPDPSPHAPDVEPPAPEG